VTGREIVLVVILGLLINECSEVSPWAARKLVRWAARHRYANPTRTDIRAEELAGLIDVRPGKLFKLVTALGFVVAAAIICVARGVSHLVPTTFKHLARRMTRRGGRPTATTFFGAPVVVMDTSARGVEALDARHGGGFVNNLECGWVGGALRILDWDLSTRGESATVSVLAYYRTQAVAIRSLLDEVAPGFRSLRFEVVGTIDEALDRESDYVIVSFCRSSRTHPRPAFGRFLQDVRRLHVAVTRARRTVVLVGHVPTLRRLGGPDSEFAAHFTRLIDREDVTVIRDLRWARHGDAEGGVTLPRDGRTGRGAPGSPGIAR
jgi:hypothetical protein